MSVVSVHDLSDELLIDFRWYLGEPDRGRREYEAGHIPGAVFVDLEHVTGDVGDGLQGRHPLPTRERFEAAMRAAGVNNSDRVVVYDDAAGSVASRLWWLLRAFGHTDAAVLDGGIQAWTGGLVSGSPLVSVGDFVASEIDLSQVLSPDEVASLEGAVLIDVRAGERYRGETEPIDPVAGHIPGAQNAFWLGSVAAGGAFRSPEDVRATFEQLGVTEDNAVVYCGSGVVAAQTILALERAGFRPKLFAGGWSAWSQRAVRGDALVETGPTAGA